MPLSEGHPKGSSWKSALALVLGLPLLDGFLYSLAFPPAHLPTAALVTGTLTLFCLRRLSLGKALVAAFIYGISGAVFIAHWVYTALHEHYHVGILPSTLFTGVIVGGGVGMYVAAPLWIWRLGVGEKAETSGTPLPRALLAASLWGLFEWVRTHGPTSMPWGIAGGAFSPWEVFSQSADLFGVLGLTFLSMFSAALFYESLEAWLSSRRQGARPGRAVFFPLAAVAIVLVGHWIYGAARLASIKSLLASPSVQEKKLRVALIQANIPQGNRWREELVDKNMRTHIEMSVEALKEGADLVVWPETAMNTYITDEGDPYKREIHQLAYKNGAHFLLGGPHAILDGEVPQYFNSIFHLDPVRGLVDRYDKRQLLAFAEYNPLFEAPFFPRPKEVPRDYTPGHSSHVFEIKGARVGSMICFEALYPWLARDLVKNGATVLLNVSNDAWFLKTAAATQHIEQARLRAIELRRYLIRNAGTGISAVVDPTGAYSSEKLPIFTSGIVRGEIFPLEIKTPYALWGDWPVVAGGLGLIGFYFWRKKRNPQ